MPTCTDALRLLAIGLPSAEICLALTVIVGGASAAMLIAAFTGRNHID